MKLLLQRVRGARVEVDSEIVGAIDQGLLVLVGIEPQDDATTLAKGLKRMLAYRVFSDAEGKMNLSLTDVNGGLLLVSQFTLAADTKSGLRPSFSTAAPPAQGLALFEQLVALAREQHPQVATGRFGADMQVYLVNDGPVTFLLDI
ncbi:D-aminoacyl-tRNA deacylase [Pseudomonas sp. ML96]|uniref:D-aminoacyl-tRNA deacylase n=1 Tax=Pseudomonas sp. ML96 TaxID=1523503 RepID=UPI0005BAEA38|nr:D-aminoacyl-tRNA deacylase [Pseudomonas sp. ML96]